MAENINVGNLGIQITSNATMAVEAIQKLTKEVNNSNKSLGNMSRESTKALQTMAGTFNSLKSSFLFSVGFGSLYQSLNTITRTMKSGFQEASNFVENYNLFNVSFAGETKEAIKYQYQLNDAFKVNMSESMRYQGFFKNLTSSLGITNDASTLLSENLTNLTYDLSSLYNTSFALMYSKLQSGIVGQTKPLRSVGIDVTQQTLQPLLYDMGINKYVTELTQAEKVLLRYISILKQSTSAQGDFARTIETPANQIRIFSDQLAEMTRWFGTMFIGMIGNILPYVNAFIIVLKEVFKWISLAFGFKVEDYDFISGNNGIGDIEEDLSGATDASEKLRKSLAGFDEINNIASATDGNMAFNTGGLSDTYYELLDNLKSYDNLMGGISTKAGRIADDVMNWLGFSKKINSETGEITYKFDGLNTNTSLLLATVSGLAGIKLAKVISGFKVLGSTSGSVGTLATNMSTLFTPIVVFGDKILTFFGIITGSTMVAGLTGLVTILGLVAAGVGALYYATRDSIPEIDVFGKSISDLTKEKVQPFLDSMEDLDNTIKNISWSKRILTDEDVQDIGKKLTRITNNILNELDADRNSALNKLEPLKYAMSDDKFSAMTERVNLFYSEVSLDIKKGEERINAILQKAKDDGTSITEEQQKEIEEIQKKMKTTGITYLSETEKESAIILGRIKDNATSLSKRQMAEIVGDALVTKNETIQAAQDQYNGVMAEFEKMKDYGLITQQEYDEIEKIARDTRDDTIKSANEQYKGILDKAKEYFPQINSYINQETGKIKTNLERMTDFLKSVGPESFASSTLSKWVSDAMNALQALSQKFADVLNQISSGAGITIGNGYTPNPTFTPIPSPSPTPTPKPKPKPTTSGVNTPIIVPYASGGFPTSGEMFIARESGAELVGSIGGRTAVMNNEQIVQAVSIGVANAVSSVMGNDNGGNVILQVNDVTLGRVAINAINKTMKNTNLVLEV